MEGIFPSLLSPFKQFTFLFEANDLPNQNPFRITIHVAHNPVSVSKTAWLFQAGKKYPACVVRWCHFAGAEGSDDGSANLPASTSESEIWFVSNVAPIV